MFYGRPKIEPLNWDLTDLPTHNGSRNFDAMTADGRPIDIRFSSGWLTVDIGEPGAAADAPMKTVVEMEISPFGTIDIWPEDICYLLGLTVQGEKIEIEPVPGAAFDWTGATTTWVSEHNMPAAEADDFIREIIAAFPGAVVLTHRNVGMGVWSFRPVTAMKDADGIVMIGVTPKPDKAANVLNGTPLPFHEAEAAFENIIHFSGRPFGDTPANADWLKSKERFKYEVPAFGRFSLRTAYVTEDARGKEFMQKMLDLIERRFTTKIAYIDIETGERIRAEDSGSYYSRGLADWCRAAPERYLRVGEETAKLRQIQGASALALADGERTVFYGVRPA